MIIIKKIIIILLVLVFSFCINFYLLLDKEVISYIHSSFKFTLEESSYKIGTLKIIGTSFSKVLVQSTDNKFFLSHDVDGNKSNLGSVFLDYRNKITDKKLLIYGHNSKTIKEAPFHFLENYLNYEFALVHDELLLETNNELFYYRLFTVMIVDHDFQHINLNWSKEGYKNHLVWLEENSLFDFENDISSSDSIIIFQTCYYYPEDSYLLIGWKKITYKKKP